MQKICFSCSHIDGEVRYPADRIGIVIGDEDLVVAEHVMGLQGGVRADEVDAIVLVTRYGSCSLAFGACSLFHSGTRTRLLRISVPAIAETGIDTNVRT